ncbi:Xylosyltransferase 2 [Quaeritorhiza haematococci]|nr:Xylosyltransferase 2 [Quaeritorhiza haematococci]
MNLRFRRRQPWNNYGIIASAAHLPNAAISKIFYLIFYLACLSVILLVWPERFISFRAECQAGYRTEAKGSGTLVPLMIRWEDDAELGSAEDVQSVLQGAQGKEGAKDGEGESLSGNQTTLLDLTAETNSTATSLNTTASDAVAVIEEKKAEGILTIQEAARLGAAVRNRLFVGRGFQLCSMLDGSTFDSLVPIEPLGGAVAEVNPPMKNFTDIIDAAALEVFDWLTQSNDTLEMRIERHPDILRLACYSAAEGATPVTNVTDERLLHRLNPPTYFRSVLPNMQQADSTIPEPRRKYKLAYLIMVHQEKGIENLKTLVSALDDGLAIILIHVDAQVPTLKNKIQNWIKEKETAAGLTEPGNVFVASHSYRGLWGHISLVMMQINGFFELRDLAEWDYVINLSNYDWPLRTNIDIHTSLSNHTGKNWVQYWTSPSKYT